VSVPGAGRLSVSSVVFSGAGRVIGDDAHPIRVYIDRQLANRQEEARNTSIFLTFRASWCFLPLHWSSRNSRGAAHATRTGSVRTAGDIRLFELLQCFVKLIQIENAFRRLERQLRQPYYRHLM
jgi:hypothetical protein